MSQDIAAHGTNDTSAVTLNQAPTPEAGPSRTSANDEKRTAENVVSNTGDAEDEGHGQTPSVRSRNTWKSVGLVTTCTFAMMANASANTSASIAFPTIGAKLHIPEARLQWIASAYSLSSGCLLLFFGRLADLYGRKRAFLAGSLCMVAFSIGCALAKDEITLDVLRGLQGCGAAATIPASLGILAHAFPPSRARTLAFATFSAGSPIGAAFGMIIGGVLTQLTTPTWRSTFWFSTAFAAVCLVGGFFFIDPDLPSTESDRRVDWIGALLATAGLVLIVFVLSDGELAPDEWKTSYIIAFLILGVALIVAFLLWQRYLERVADNPDPSKSHARNRWTPPPLMRVSLWGRAHGKFAAMQFVAFLNWACFIALQFWIQLYYQSYVGLSPILTMVRLLPMFVTGVICNVFVALLIGRVDVIFLVVTGTVLTSCGALLFAVIVPSAPYWAFGFPSAVISVFGADFVFASGTLFVAKVALPHEQSLAGALFQTMTQLGTAFGLTISTIVFNRVLKRESRERGVNTSGVDASAAPRPAQLEAYKAAQWTTFGFGMLATALALIYLRNVGIIGASHKKKGKTAPEAPAADGSDAEKAHA
ncbi:MFS general substrate transporter [Punctularia strigosozonata HHB-11173 SS5]|uniref:MFS general substrate transporter n=1 Tax=Punctularia strigosozonata (strain HHB-11173) TaxID=741275 RepID=R7S0W6_PUNST|nr:MFS general substrate transporter [Punctularia strigosozonata HHB-11173 SS5]EIN03494.1 MFS general substrate transporter [Punctularia strigosozonata HHB-11173 SS5]